MFFSKLTNGFYLTEFHGTNMPEDVVEITKERHIELLAGQEAGLVISSDENGDPILISPPPLSYSDFRAAEYPSFAEQFDLLYHGGYEGWKTVIASVKAKYPKP